MYHTFDVLCSTVSQLNALTKDFNKESKCRTLSKVPEFITMSFIRDNSGLIDEFDTTKLIKPFKASNFPIYITVGTNIKYSIVEKIPVMVSSKEFNGVDNAVSIIVPMILFSEDIDIEQTVDILQDLYFKILSLDRDFKYKPDMKILYLSDSNKIYIPTYDVTMVLAALACVNINVVSWFGFAGVNDEVSSVDSSETVQWILKKYENVWDKDNWLKYQDKLVNTFNKHAKTTSELRDAISGRLVKTFFTDK